MSTNAVRAAVFGLAPPLRAAFARDLLYDLLRNELADSDHAGGFTRDQVLAAWRALENDERLVEETLERLRAELGR